MAKPRSEESKAATKRPSETCRILKFLLKQVADIKCRIEEEQSRLEQKMAASGRTDKSPLVRYQIAERPMPQPLVWINGFPGVGKLTIARIMAARDSTIVLIDNHQLIDPVEENYSRDHPEYQAERKQERERAFERWVSNPEMRCKTIVFTGTDALSLPMEAGWVTDHRADFQSTSAGGRAVAREYYEAAVKADRAFIPIYLHCEAEENVTRLRSEERLLGPKRKLTDEKTLRDYLCRCKLCEPYPGRHIETLESFKPDEVADMILDYVERRTLFRRLSRRRHGSTVLPLVGEQSGCGLV